MLDDFVKPHLSYLKLAYLVRQASRLWRGWLCQQLRQQSLVSHGCGQQTLNILDLGMSAGFGGPLFLLHISRRFLSKRGGSTARDVFARVSFVGLGLCWNQSWYLIDLPQTPSQGVQASVDHRNSEFHPDSGWKPWECDNSDLPGRYLGSHFPRHRGIEFCLRPTFQDSPTSVALGRSGVGTSTQHLWIHVGISWSQPSSVAWVMLRRRWAIDIVQRRGFWEQNGPVKNDAWERNRPVEIWKSRYIVFLCSSWCFQHVPATMKNRCIPSCSFCSTYDWAKGLRKTSIPCACFGHTSLEP